MADFTEEIYDAYAHIPIDGVPDEVNNALRIISDNLFRQSNSPVIPIRNSAPRRVYNGLIVFADGLNWNPGFGRGVYVWDSNVDVDAILSDGALIGTIPDWQPTGDYTIQVSFNSLSSSPLQIHPIVSSNTAGNNNRNTFEQLADNKMFARHASGTGSSDGEVISASAVPDELVSRASMHISANSDLISVTINDVSTSVVFNQYKGAPTFNTIFSDAIDGIANGIVIGRLIMTDDLGGDNRSYLFGDGLSGIITDSGGGNQDGTWNAIGSGNLVKQKGAWIPLSNIII